MKLSSPKIKKVLIFYQNMLLLYFSKRKFFKNTSYIPRVNKNRKKPTKKKCYTLWEMELSSPKLKKFIHSSSELLQ